jgi:hypothetical protein
LLQTPKYQVIQIEINKNKTKKIEKRKGSPAGQSALVHRKQSPELFCPVREEVLAALPRRCMDPGVWDRACRFTGAPEIILS